MNSMDSSEDTVVLPDRQLHARRRVPPPPTRRSFPRALSSLLLFLLGILVGMLALSAFVLLTNPDRSPLPVTPNPAPAALLVQASASYVSQIAQQKSSSFGVPGTLKNLQVSFVHDGPVTVSGDDELSLLGLTMTKHFTLQLQLYANACKPTVRVLHANFSGIPITGFASMFEQSLNQQLQNNLTGLPPGFTYCVTAIHTETQVALITLSAQPTGQSATTGTPG